MTDTNRSNEELPALIEERRKFDGWLSALNARRESTPQHVFDRVRADYERRMRHVEERLAAHRHSMLEERTSLESRRSLLEAEDQLRRDERSELELRTHVGELSGAEAEASFAAIDDALANMAREREGLDKRIEELDGLLNLPGGDLPEQTGDFDKSVPVSGEFESVAAADGVATPTEGTSAGFTPSEGAVAQSASDHAPATSGENAEGHRSAESAREPSNPAPLLRPTPGGGFDELGFLTNVVGLKDAGTAPLVSNVPDAPEPKSLLDGVAPGRTSGRPLGSNVGNTPIMLRTSGPIEQTKTLKCTECGALNYPTEWYCERCGAELAAL